MTRRWFLHRRITVAFGLTTFCLSLALSVPFGWIVHSTIQEEIEALAREELEETKAHFAERTPSVSEFMHIVEKMRADHPANPMAWRIWRSGDGSLWTEFGAPALLQRVGTGTGPQGIRSPDEGTRLALGRLSEELTAAVVLDVSSQVGRFRRALWAALVFVLVATAVATLAGRLLALRVSRLLAEVAASAGTHDTSAEFPAPAAAPEEIQAVVRALQDTLKRIREESENARLLIAGLAHELRSPLQNLMGETQVALLRQREPTEYRRVLESQLEDLGELSRVIDNLVTLSSVEEMRRRGRRVECFDLVEEARLRLARERQLAKRRGVELVFVADGPLRVEGDRESLLLALRNVVTNAIEWSPVAGAVEIRLSSGAEGVEIVVDDAGPGIPPDARALIFRPFQRGPAAKGRRVGFGLGLALTQSVVRAQGGHIEVGDSPAGGARFRILLPPSASD